MLVMSRGNEVLFNTRYVRLHSAARACARYSELFVHDMAKSPWDAPEDEFFIDARTAWYVVGHSLTGAMGSTLASFAEKTDAEAFSSQYGGKVITYTDIDHDVI